MLVDGKPNVSKANRQSVSISNIITGARELLNVVAETSL